MDLKAISDLNPSPRILLGPGPSMASPRVLRAMSTPLVGHLDPQFLTLMSEVQSMLRYVFQTENELTIPVSGTGSAGMEAALCNFIEPGDRVLVAINGYFGGRIYDMAGRYGAVVDKLERPWGEVFDPDEIEAALKSKKYKLAAIVHAETSTGALQPGIKEIAAAAHKHGALFLLDYGDLLERFAGGDRRLGRGYLLQRLAEVPVCPAGAIAADDLAAGA